MIRTLVLKFEEKQFKKLQNAKEEAKINKEVSSWEEWILKLTKIK